MKRYNLKSFREKHNLKQQEMADKLEISKSHYVNIERGIYNPTFALMEKFGEVFPGDYDDIWLLFKKGA